LCLHFSLDTRGQGTTKGQGQQQRQSKQQQEPAAQGQAKGQAAEGQQGQGQPPQRQQSKGGAASPSTVEAIARDLEGEPQDNTMQNLRKSFAGIFGDM